MATGRSREKEASCFICTKKGHKMAQCFYNAKLSSFKSSLTSSKTVIQNLKERDLISNEYNTGSGDECGFAFLAGQSPRTSRRWFLDSCALRHISNQREFMVNYRSLDKAESVNAAAEGARVRIVRIDPVRVKQDVDGKDYFFALHDVGYAPKYRTNLVELACAQRAVVTMAFEPGSTRTKAMKIGRVVMIGDSANMDKTELTGLRLVRSASTNIAFYSAGEDDATELAHRRTCHTCVRTLRLLELKGAVNGLHALKSAQKVDDLCGVCGNSKATEAPHLKHGKRTPKVLEVMHKDLSGPINPPGIGGEKYGQLLVDDYSGAI